MSTDSWEDFPPGGVHASTDFRKAMNVVQQPEISDVMEAGAKVLRLLDSAAPCAYISKNLAWLQDEYQRAKDAGTENKWHGADARVVQDYWAVSEALEILNSYFGPNRRNGK